MAADAQGTRSVLCDYRPSQKVTSPDCSTEKQESPRELSCLGPSQRASRIAALGR